MKNLITLSTFALLLTTNLFSQSLFLQKGVNSIGFNKDERSPNVGIGTSTPGAFFHINSIYTDRNFTAKFENNSSYIHFLNHSNTPAGNYANGQDIFMNNNIDKDLH